jgi:hypothetical protein
MFYVTDVRNFDVVPISGSLEMFGSLLMGITYTEK